MNPSHTPTLLNGQPLSKKAQEFADNLCSFLGTDEYHRHGFASFNLILTDGCNYVRKNGGANGAYWLFDIILSYQLKLHRYNFQVWTLEKLQEPSWQVCCQVDSQVMVRQFIDY